MGKTLKNSILVLVVAVSTYLIAGSFIERQFSIASVTIPDLPKQETQLSEETAALANLFNKPFTYLDRGHQSFVFLSNDGKFVLKFFDVNSLRGYSYIPFVKRHDTTRTERRLNDLLNGYRIAYEKDRENCGLLYFQVSPNPSMEYTVVLKDRFGFVHHVDLSKVPFVVQKVAVTTRATLYKLLAKGNVSEAKERLGAIVDMYFDEYRKGIYDRDRNYIDNTGFIGQQPIRIDAGRLRYDPEIKNPSFYSKDIYNVLIKRSDRFLRKYFPLYRDEIVDFLEKKILAEL